MAANYLADYIFYFHNKQAKPFSFCFWLKNRFLLPIMCEKCLKEEYPNRDRMCLDSGAYMANLKACCLCQSVQVKVLNKIVTEDSGIEVIVFEHVCGTCQHVISIHNYKFWIEGDYQEYEMDCALCGVAEDSISILPDDPRKASFDFF